MVPIDGAKQEVGVGASDLASFVCLCARRQEVSTGSAVSYPDYLIRW